jgi:hypothetical protein
VDLRLEDFYVWRFEDGHAELRMCFDVAVVVSIECVKLPDFQISEFTGLTYWDDEEDEDNPLTLVLECSADLTVRAGLRVENDGLSEPVLDGILLPQESGLSERNGTVVSLPSRTTWGDELHGIAVGRGESRGPGAREPGW